MGEYNTFNWEDILMFPAELTNTSSGLISKYKNENVITLGAELTISRDKIDGSNPDVADKMIRIDLARQLINKILSEDLITIEHDASEMDPLHQSVTFRTKLKILQEC